MNTTPNINKVLRGDPVSCKRGAPLGQGSFHEAVSPLYLQRIRFVDGDYAPDGTYWGSGGEPLYCAFNGEDEQFAPAAGSRIYVRASSRQAAKQRVCSQFPNVHFKR